jgi:EmrB/QacA subfamily drug resistance transporter
MKAPRDEARIRAEKQSSSRPATAGCWVLTAAILASSMAFIDSTVVNVALPAIQSGFHATVTGMQWVVEAYGLFLGALILTGGSLGDRFGRRLIFLLGVSIFALASLACGLASSVDRLIVARSVQGVGAALLVPGSLAIISVFFEEKDRGHAIGLWSGFTAITTAAGPVMGGWLIDHASWRWAFFLNLPLAIAVIAISVWRVPESKSAEAGRLDWIGALLATLGLGGLVASFTESIEVGWRNPLVLGGLTGGLGLLVAFVLVEARIGVPMLPLKLFKARSFSGANLFTLFIYAAIGIFFFLLPLNLIQVQRYSATEAGLAILPLILLMFLLSRWAGGLVARYGARRPLTLGPLMTALGFLLLALPATGGSYWEDFFPGLVVLGLGMAITVAPLTTVVMNSAGADQAGAASGTNNAVARIAGVLAVAVLGAWMAEAFASHLNRELAQLRLPPELLNAILSNKTKLAGLPIPVGLSAATIATVRQAIDASFVFGFRMILLFCAGLAAVSAAVGRLTIRD